MGKVNKLDTYHINPYNFVPFGEKCLRIPIDKEDVLSKKVTGKITCTLIPKSDFFIPNTSNISCDWSGRKENTEKSKDENTEKSKDENKHKAKEFFSYQNLNENYSMDNSGPEQPVIPGSEIRGMVRNMYETFTDSCLSAFDAQELSSRFPVALKPGILEIDNLGNWKLIQAEKHSINTESGRSKDPLFNIIIENDSKTINGFKTFSKVKFDYFFKNGQKRVTKIDNKCKNEGYLIIGEKKADENGKCNKYKEYIFSEKRNKNTNALMYEFVDLKKDERNEIVKSAVEAYKELLEIYKNNSESKWYKDSLISMEVVNKKRRENPKLGSIKFPVWYLITKDSNEKEKKLYLSPACIGRINYDNTMINFVKDYSSCDDSLYKKGLCEACKLFGTIYKKKEEDNRGDNNKDTNVSFSSNVRISDASFINKYGNPIYAPITTLKELSGPKITSMEMYTHMKDNSKFWTYEFYRKDKLINEKTIKNYIYLEDDMFELNGRKFYYHNTTNNLYKEKVNKTDKYGKDVEQTERNITIRPMKGDERNVFKFDVYFEKISQEQLKKLLVVLSMRGNDSSYCYKLGTGKPLGLGSVKIKVEDVFLRNINPYTFEYSLEKETDNYKEFFTNDRINLFEISKNLQRLKKLNELTDLKTFTEEEMNHIGYPVGVIEDENSNKKTGEGYQWFMTNRGDIGNPVYDQTLFAAKKGMLYDNFKKNKK